MDTPATPAAAPKPAATPLAHRIPEACARLGFSRSTMYALLAEGRIRAMKVGARRLVPESELQRFVAERLAAA